MGYFAFARDQELRNKQMKTLEMLREQVRGEASQGQGGEQGLWLVTLRKQLRAASETPLAVPGPRRSREGSCHTAPVSQTLTTISEVTCVTLMF